MIRVNVVAEGKSEMYFAKRILNGYFQGALILDSRCVRTSVNTRSNYEYRGGLLSYAQAKGDIVRWLQGDTNAYITTISQYCSNSS